MIAKSNIKYFVREGELEKIENYDKAIADKVNTWVFHHRLELTLDGEFAHSREDLKRMGMYYHRPYFELILVTKAEHNRLHRHNKGKSPSAETRKKISEAHKGKHLSEEHKKKLSETLKNNSPLRGRPKSEEIKKRISETKKNKPHSEFGIKYLAHYGYGKHENPNLYEKERRWYCKNNHKCSWEQ